MIVGLGVDVFEVSRMERALQEGEPGLADDLFTPGEIADCRQQPHPARHLAARFAAKEAIVKALASNEADDRASDGSEHGSWHDVELRTSGGRATDPPQVFLHGPLKTLADRKGVTRVLVAMAPARRLAMATAILECPDA